MVEASFWQHLAHNFWHTMSLASLLRNIVMQILLMAKDAGRLITKAARLRGVTLTDLYIASRVPSNNHVDTLTEKSQLYAIGSIRHSVTQSATSILYRLLTVTDVQLTI